MYFLAGARSRESTEIDKDRPVAEIPRCFQPVLPLPPNNDDLVHFSSGVSRVQNNEVVGERP